MTVSFTTSNSSGKYYINDTSTDIGAADYKTVTIANINGTEIFNSGHISVSSNPVEVDTSNWLSENALLQIAVSLRYPTPGGDGVTLTKVYLLPTTLNIAS